MCVSNADYGNWTLDSVRSDLVSPAESRYWDVDAGSTSASLNAIIAKPSLNQHHLAIVPATSMGSYSFSQRMLPA